MLESFLSPFFRTYMILGITWSDWWLSQCPSYSRLHYTVILGSHDRVVGSHDLLSSFFVILGSHDQVMGSHDQIRLLRVPPTSYLPLHRVILGSPWSGHGITWSGHGITWSDQNSLSIRHILLCVIYTSFCLLYTRWFSHSHTHY